MEKHFKAYAGIIVQDFMFLDKWEIALSHADEADTVSFVEIQHIRHFAEGMLTTCAELKMRMSETAAARLSHLCLNSNNSRQIHLELQDLRRRIIEELHGIIFYKIAPSDVRYFADGELFGDQVRQRFPSACDDIDEAGKCLALNRGTACVFHLMRAMERAIKAVYKTLGIRSPNKSDSWGNLMSPMDAEQAKPPKDRNALWVKEESFFAEAVADLRAIKKAWRDSTMHVEKDYTVEQAQKIFSATEGFMRDLAKRLDEDGEMHPLG